MALSREGRTLLFLFLIWLIYLTIGMLIFRAVEHDGDKKPEKTKEQLLEKLKLNITAKYNMSKTDFDNLVQKIEEASSSNAGPEWSYAESMSFVIQLVTTIGYGNITPVTTGGRVLCIFFALFGIPINILFLQLIGDRMLHGEKYLVTKFETRCLKREGVPRYLNEKCSMLGILLLVILLFSCAGLHTTVDGWTFFEGFYAFFITFTTVGFGDLIPGTADGKMAAPTTVIRILFIILGLAAMSNVINALANCSEAGEFFRKLKARCCRCTKRSNEVGETRERDEMELNE
ncbi:hypothetical protein ACROYT_G024277 [Oculina patagonica]